jgi:hypothetical protein
MIIEIDQSGKIEDTSKHTIVALADKKGFSRSVRISATEKRKLQKFFRNIGHPILYTYKVFAVLIFIIIKDYISKIDRIIIDPEYPGHEQAIRDLLFGLIKTVDKKFERNRIVFKQIGKRSPAHLKAYTTYRRKQKPNLIVTRKDVLKIIILK